MGADFFATKLRKKLGLTTPPFLPQTAFSSLGVAFQECKLEGCLGMTLRVDGNIGVMVSNNIPEEGKRLFTAAHELGHVTIPSHEKISQFKCTSTDLWGNSNKRHELEANEFAAEWLMPKEIFKLRCAKFEPDFNMISMTASEFSVSLTAAVTRYVEFTEHEVMLVVSKNGIMKYFKPSQDFPYRLDYGVVPNTYTRNSLIGEPFPSEFMAVASDDWFEGEQPDDNEVLECSVKLGDYDTVLTMLWVE